MNNFTYSFPAYRKEGSAAAQVAHIFEEALEALEVMQDNEERFLEELLDCYHAIETELRKHDYNKVNAAYFGVIEKNERRGYYD